MQEEKFKHVLSTLQNTVRSGDKLIVLEKGRDLIKQILKQPLVLSRELSENDEYMANLIITLSQMLHTQQSIYSNILLFNNFHPENTPEANKVFFQLHGENDLHSDLLNQCLFTLLNKISDEFEKRKKDINNPIRYSKKMESFSQFFESKKSPPNLYEFFYFVSSDDQDLIFKIKAQYQSFLEIFKNGYKVFSHKKDDLFYYLVIAYYVAEILKITSTILSVSLLRGKVD